MSDEGQPNGSGEWSFPCAIDAPHPPGKAIDLLEALAKRGKLPGFERTGDGTCRVSAHGTPFDRDVEIAATTRGDGSRVELSLAWRRQAPAIYAAVLLLAIWPGVVLTDSFLSGFGWYNAIARATGPVEPWFTWAWYLPLTVLPAPFMFRGALRKSAESSAEHAGEQAQKIRAALSGSAAR